MELFGALVLVVLVIVLVVLVIGLGAGLAFLADRMGAQRRELRSLGDAFLRSEKDLNKKIEEMSISARSLRVDLMRLDRDYGHLKTLEECLEDRVHKAEKSVDALLAVLKEEEAHTRGRLNEVAYAFDALRRRVEKLDGAEAASKDGLNHSTGQLDW